MGGSNLGSLQPDDIQELILFSRGWRFVRVGHGIATSVNDMVRSKQQELTTTVSELKAALRQLEGELAKERRRDRPESNKHVGEETSSGLHRAHGALTTLEQQVAY
uniref:Uncharacterized protein n=1 Tax=Haptolina brevifila TaxID=156173 RepID=A0A7S2GE72_9EUKA|mmetsp:Transcript_34942/g.69746  ORF Transcript_34942/g.69746 Transcript_34942/m.69746 type:complete len:106 (+) Transcript_34942:21-338(+)